MSSSSLQPTKKNKRSPPSCHSTDTYNNKKIKATSSSSTRDVVNNDDITKINNQGLQVSVLVLMSLTVSIRVHILNYLGQTQDELTNLTLVSKQMYQDCKRPGIEWKIIPMIEIRPLQLQQGGSTQTLMQNLTRRLLNNNTNTKLRRYPHMKVNDINEFDYIPSIEINEIVSYTHNEITKYVEMDWVLSLDMSLSTPERVVTSHSLPYGLSNTLPKLRVIDLSNIGASATFTLRNFSRRCQHLEKVTWNNIGMTAYVKLNGGDMKFSNTGNLKEIIMDDSELCCSSLDRGIDKMSTLGNHRDTFIFHRCSNALESVSIQNAKCFNTNFNYRNYNLCLIPQNALIKFVRSVPSLRWFRSDLTQENMDMLRLERPGIELLN
ncbi:MAG: hypothetical protein ACI8RD_008905 [Bacillariaceae sp.]|jgi:hypothetical protein